MMQIVNSLKYNLFFVGNGEIEHYQLPASQNCFTKHIQIKSQLARSKLETIIVILSYDLSPGGQKMETDDETNQLEGCLYG